MRRRSISWRRVAVLAAGATLALYAVVLTVMFVEQRHLLYFPTAVGAAPAVGGPQMQVVSIDTEDGERLVAWWSPPQAGRPTFLFFGGNAMTLAGGDGRWRRIAAQGAGVLAVAYRGYDGSTGEPSEAGLHKDASAAWRWLSSRVPAEDVVIHGFSLGTGVATQLAAEHKARALVLEAPYTSTADVAAVAYPWVPVHLLMLDQFRSKDQIGRVQMPVLIVHGDADEVVPYSQGRRLYDLAGPPKAFVRMVGSNHNTLVSDGVYAHIWRFLGLPDIGNTAVRGHAAKVEVIGDSPSPVSPQ
ncbi:MAG: alpha/beta hydrolase [Caulobacterales bacterium]|nr:alpha/beta hydrolase [Caulobacterales bacterium]